MQSVQASPSSAVTGRHLGTGVALTLLGGAGWGFSGTCAQFLFDVYGVRPTWLVAVRMAIAAALFLPLLLFPKREAWLALVRDRRSLGSTAVFAVLGVFACTSCYLKSIEASNAGTATVLQSLNLLLLLGYTCVRLRRRPTVKECAGIVLALAGTFLLATHGSLTSLSIPLEALVWGLANACACALYTLLPARPLSRYGGVAVTGTGVMVCAALSLAVYRPWECMPALDLAGWGAVFAVALVGTFGSFLLYMTGVKMVGSLLAGLLASSEPIVACILSVTWMGTVFLPVDIVGIVLILVMMVLMV